MHGSYLKFTQITIHVENIWVKGMLPLSVWSAVSAWDCYSVAANVREEGILGLVVGICGRRREEEEEAPRRVRNGRRFPDLDRSGLNPNYLSTEEEIGKMCVRGRKKKIGRPDPKSV